MDLVFFCLFLHPTLSLGYPKNLNSCTLMLHFQQTNSISMNAPISLVICRPNIQKFFMEQMHSDKWINAKDKALFSPEKRANWWGVSPKNCRGSHDNWHAWFPPLVIDHWQNHQTRWCLLEEPFKNDLSYGVRTCLHGVNHVRGIGKYGELSQTRDTSWLLSVCEYICTSSVTLCPHCLRADQDLCISRFLVSCTK